MKISSVETVRLPEHPEHLWVRVASETGDVGMGETMPRVGPVDAIIHDVLAPMLVDRETSPEEFWKRAFHTVSYHGYAGAELRAMSAIDMALWDLLGQETGLPVYRLLGGPCRGRIPVYNTCASAGDIRDHERFLSEPGELARDLVSAGYPAMKIWPFDQYSVAGEGQWIGNDDLARGVRVFEEIREAVGDRVDIALEGHSCWSLPAAVRIAKALEPYEPLWLEDMLHTGNPRTWRQLREETGTPLCGSERLLSRFSVQPFLENESIDIVNQDVAWTGGITEFRKVASLAESFGLAVAPHNCLGPVGMAATLHVSAAIPNLYLVESVRAFVASHGDVASSVVEIENGSIGITDGNGLGVRIRPEVVDRADIRITSEAKSPGWEGGDPWVGKLGDRI